MIFCSLKVFCISWKLISNQLSKLLGLTISGKSLMKLEAVNHRICALVHLGKPNPQCSITPPAISDWIKLDFFRHTVFSIRCIWKEYIVYTYGLGDKRSWSVLHPCEKAWNQYFYPVIGLSMVTTLNSILTHFNLLFIPTLLCSVSECCSSFDLAVWYVCWKSIVSHGPSNLGQQISWLHLYKIKSYLELICVQTRKQSLKFKT